MIKYLKDNLPANYQHKNNVKLLKEHLTNKILMGDIKLNNGQEADKEYWLKFYFDNKSSLSEVSESNFKILKRYSKKDSFGSLEIDERLLESIFGKVTNQNKDVYYEPEKYDVYILPSGMFPGGLPERNSELISAVLKHRFKYNPTHIDMQTNHKRFVKLYIQEGYNYKLLKEDKKQTLGDIYVYNTVIGLQGEKNALKAAELLLEAYDKTDDKILKSAIEKYYDRHIRQIDQVKYFPQIKEKIEIVQAINPKILIQSYKQLYGTTQDVIKKDLKHLTQYYREISKSVKDS